MGYTLQQLQAMGAKPVQKAQPQPIAGSVVPKKKYTLQELQSLGAKPLVKTIAQQRQERIAQGLPVSVNEYRVDPTVAGNIVRGIIKAPLKVLLSVPAGVMGEKGITVKSKYLGDTSDLAKTMNQSTDKLIGKVKSGEISKGRAVAGVFGNALLNTADVASVVPVGGFLESVGINTAKAIAGQTFKETAKQLAIASGKSFARGAGTGALYDIGAQVASGEKYNPVQTLQSAALGGALDVGLSQVAPKIIGGVASKGKQVYTDKFTQEGRSSGVDKYIRKIFEGTTGDVQKLNDSAFKARKGLELLNKESSSILIPDESAPLGSGVTKPFNLQKAKPNELLSAVSEIDNKIASVARESAQEASQRGVKIDIAQAKQRIRKSIDNGDVSKATGERMLLQIESTGGDPLKVHDWVQDINIKYGKKYQRGTIDDTAIGSLADDTAETLRNNLDTVLDRRGYAEAFGNNQELKRMLVTIAKKANKNVNFGNIASDAGLDFGISVLTGNPAYMARTVGMGVFRGLISKFRNNAGLRAFRNASVGVSKIPTTTKLPTSGIKIKEVPEQFRLPAGPELGTQDNPIILGGRTGENSVKLLPAKKGLVGINPKTGRFTKTYTSEVAQKNVAQPPKNTQSTIKTSTMGDAKTIKASVNIPKTPKKSNVDIPKTTPEPKVKSNDIGNTLEQGKQPVEAFGKVSPGFLFGVGGASALGVAALGVSNKIKKDVSEIKKITDEQIAIRDKRSMDAIKSAISFNESSKTGDPYKFRKQSGIKKYGEDLGKYQITTAKLNENSKRFLGRQVSPDEFINNPKLQEKFIESEINFLLNKSYTLPQIFAAHRSGWSDFGEKQEKVYNRKKYVDSAINHYIKVLSKS